MESDATLGGTEHLPHTANSLKFAASRSVEIAAMTESILRPSKTKLIFQSLPVHMRRRVMSHNCKRLPQRLREGHLEQLKKSGLPPKQKRPSRKYRRRPRNLLEEYNRRQKKNIWLETHIWHAKRFHMVDRWGYRLPHRSCDKAFRACYRASSAHCLMQDISYYIPIQIKGSVEIIKDMFNCLTSSECGLGVCAKAYFNGNRKGTIDLYKPNSYPFEFIGKVEYLWVQNDSKIKELLLFLHPTQAKQVESILCDIINKPNLKCEDKNANNAKRRKISTQYSEIQVKNLSGMFNRFRLTGPKSQAVLAQTLKCVKNIDNIASNKWVIQAKNKNIDLLLQPKYDYWESIKTVITPSQLPPGIIIGLIVKDPRLSRPKKRTKAQNSNEYKTNISTLVTMPPYTSASPVWDVSVTDIIKSNKITNTQYIDHISKTQLIPGEINEDDPFLQSIPIVLIQRPGSQNANYKKIGYGCGWDIIIPAGYSLPFWLTFIMFGARTGGLREVESLAFEIGACYLPPDSIAGKVEEKRMESELKEKYFRRPPSKRVNYVKLAVPSPFICPWNILLKEWGNVTDEKLYVLRNRAVLDNLKICLETKTALPKIENANMCLVPIYIEIIGKGSLSKHAMICLPYKSDLLSKETVMEPLQNDGNAILRKQKRAEHKKLIKQMRKRRIKLRSKKGQNGKILNENKDEPSAYVKSMRELWLPSDFKEVRYVGSREVMGYLLQGAYSFTEAKSCGVGYILYNALTKLLGSGLNQVLIRNTTSRKYSIANIQIITTS